MKTAFVSKSTLISFNPDCETILEANSSEYITGDVLFQFDNKSVLKPCVYFLKKNSSVKCNYKIYNKKLLTIIYCLQEWDAELHSVKKFIVITNYKNLKYFMQFWKFNEWYVRWLIFLNRYNMTMKYCSESKNSHIDALFWRDQNNLNEKDEWMSHWFFQLLKPTSASLFDDEENGTEAVLTMAVTMAPTVTTSIFTNEFNRIEWF